MIDKIIYIGREKGCHACSVLYPKFEKKCFDIGFKNFYKVDAESEEGENLCEMYGVRNVPTVISFDEKGNQIGRAVGTMTDEEIDNFLNK